MPETESEDDDLVQKRECPYCEWEVEKKIITEMDEYDLDDRAERHYETAHCGKARVKVVLETEIMLQPGTDGHDIADRAHERFEDEMIAGYELAYTAAEVLDEPERVEQE